MPGAIVHIKNVEMNSRDEYVGLESTTSGTLIRHSSLLHLR